MNFLYSPGDVAKLRSAKVRGFKHADQEESENDDGPVPPPSPKKRKAGVVSKGDSVPAPNKYDGSKLENDSQDDEEEESKGEDEEQKAYSSLADVLAQFADIQLNKDFYDSIKKTESRCDLGSDNDVRDSDRKAFDAALEQIEKCIEESIELEDVDVDSGLLSSGVSEVLDQCRERSRENVFRAFCLVSLSLEVIRLLVDFGGTSSASVTVELTEMTDPRTKSLEKSISEKHIALKESSVCFVDDADEGLSPIKAAHGKHPRQGQTHDDGCKESNPVSEVLSLISNDPPKRQRKDEDEASSKFPEAFTDLNEPNTRGLSTAESGPSASPATTNSTSDERTERKEACSDGNVSAAFCDDMVKGVGRSDNNRDESGEQEKNHPWGSSLVCADLSLNDVGSNLYGPVVAYLKASGVLDGKMIQKSFHDVRCKSACDDNPEHMGKMLAEKICDLAEHVYQEFDLRVLPGVRVALVAAAFENIIKRYIHDV